MPAHVIAHGDLTPVHTGHTVCRKERRNSQQRSGTAPDSIAVFLRLQFVRLDSFYVGRAAVIQHPQGENCPPVYVPVSTLPTLSGAARGNVSPEFQNSNVGDVFMRYTAQAAPAAFIARGHAAAAANSDAAFHDIHSFMHALANLRHMGNAQFACLADTLEANSRPLEAWTVGELLTVIGAAWEVTA